MSPMELKYTKSHEWALLDEKTDIVTVGITEIATEQLGDIVFIELPEIGAELIKDQPFGVSESVKAAVYLNSPVSGQVVEVHTDLASDLDTISKDPLGAGWMVRIHCGATDEVQGLMNEAEYSKFAEQETH